MENSKLVHIVDDEEPICRSLELLLQKSGFRAKKWLDGSSFLKGADPHDPACVVLDIRMPGLDGLEVEAQMTGHGLNLPVVFMTGHGEVPTAECRKQSNAFTCLEKPFKSGELIRALLVGFNRMANYISAPHDNPFTRTWVVPLTTPERQVLYGLACGYSPRTIARDIDISARMVEVLWANTMEKLEVTNLADAVEGAFCAGLGLQKDWRQRYVAGTLRTHLHAAERRPATTSVVESMQI